MYFVSIIYMEFYVQVCLIYTKCRNWILWNASHIWMYIISSLPLEILMSSIVLSNLKVNASVPFLVTQRITVAADLRGPSIPYLKGKEKVLFFFLIFAYHFQWFPYSAMADNTNLNKIMLNKPSFYKKWCQILIIKYEVCM